jgi:hypothetical protein
VPRWPQHHKLSDTTIRTICLLGWSNHIRIEGMRFSLRNLLTFAACMAIALALIKFLLDLRPHPDPATTLCLFSLTSALMGAGLGALLQCPWRGAVIGFVSMAGTIGPLILLSR